MGEQLTLLNDGYIVWQLDAWDWPELNRALLRYKERTKRDAELIAYRPGDRAKIRPLIPDNLGIWETDAVSPGFIWVCERGVAEYYRSRDTGYSDRSQRTK